MTRSNKRKSSNETTKTSKPEEGKYDEDSYPLVANTQYQDLNQYIENLYTHNPGSSCFVMQNGSSLALTIHFGKMTAKHYRQSIT